MKDIDVAYRPHSVFNKFMYDLVLWLLTTTFDCFFREIKTRGGYKIPEKGPVIFVIAPHANQFVDPITLMRQVKQSANRRVSFLIAKSSLRKYMVGFFARSMLSIGVIRPQDNLKLAEGTITLDPENSYKIIGKGTKFAQHMEPKGLIGLPRSQGMADILSIESDTELTLRKEFKMDKKEVKSMLTKGTVFKYANKVDQSDVYNLVFEHLYRDGSLGIFPEGGSHDRTDLLPLKAGVAIMALGCMERHPDVKVKIVPCGLNYFHPHKFRSRAVVEFGEPIEISPDLIVEYSEKETKKDAVRKLLETITSGLKAVTVTCPDYETLMIVQTMRRLYTAQLPNKLPLPLIVDLNRKMVKVFKKNMHDTKIIKIRKDIISYNTHLKYYNIPDHMVETAKINFFYNTWLLVSRSLYLLCLVILALPGFVMFLPVFIAAKYFSNKKAKEALAASAVKVKAKDVLASWKILIGMGLAPLLYTFWSVAITYYFREIYKRKILTFGVIYVLFVAVTYSALIIGDMGMDIFKSLRPLYLSISTPDGLRKLQTERQYLAVRITEVINEFGHDIFQDYEANSSEEVSDDDYNKAIKNLKKRRQLKHKYKQLQSTNELYSDDTETLLESDGISMLDGESISNVPIFPNDDAGSLYSRTTTPGFSITSDFELEDDDNNNGTEISKAISQKIWSQRESQTLN